jgi:hypothetical protein
MSALTTRLTPEQSFHPTGTFVEFAKEEIEQSIPERFEKIVRMYPERIAVKTRNAALTYEALNKAANRVTSAILAEIGEGQQAVALLINIRQRWSRNLWDIEGWENMRANGFRVAVGKDQLHGARGSARCGVVLMHTQLQC